jgi:hypothetical protein
MTTYELTFREGIAGGLELNPVKEPVPDYLTFTEPENTEHFINELQRIYENEYAKWQQSEQDRKWVEIEMGENDYFDCAEKNKTKHICIDDGELIFENDHFQADKVNGKLVNLKL